MTIKREPDEIYVDPDFSETTTFYPIDDLAKDGSVQLVARGSTLAKAQWTGDMWSFPYGSNPYGDGNSICAVQIGFEPTHYTRRKPDRAKAA